MPLEEVYEASLVKRNRATNAEMEERAEFLIDYAEAHGPVTVRQLYCRHLGGGYGSAASI